MKSFDCGNKVKENGYNISKSNFDNNGYQTFSIKAKCKGLIKKEVKSVEVVASKSGSKVKNLTCTFPAGKSEFCNHVIALLLEVSDSILNQLQNVTKLIESITEMIKKRFNLHLLAAIMSEILAIKLDILNKRLAA